MSGPADRHLRVLFGHHVWATGALLDRCRELEPQQFELIAPGGFGTLIETLRHLVAADARYQARLLGEPPPEPAAEAAVEALSESMAKQGRRWQEVLERVDELDPTIPAEPEEDPPYPEIRHAADLLLAQALHHGHEHRTHAGAILVAHGLACPELSAWEYFRLRTPGLE